MKKVISLFMALILVVSAVSTVSVFADDEQLTVTLNGQNEQAYSVGEEIELMLNLDLGNTVILNGDIRITYDDDFLEFVPHEAADPSEPSGSSVDAYSLPESILDTDPIFNYSKAGQIRFNFTSEDGIGTLTGDHTFLARFRFIVKAGGSTNIIAVIQTMCDTDEKYIYSKGAFVGTSQPVFTTSLAIAPAASVNGVTYTSFAAAVSARTSDDDVVVLLDDIGTVFTLPVGGKLKVEKSIYDLTVVAPQSIYTLNYSEDNGVTTYVVTTYTATLDLRDSININFYVTNLPTDYADYTVSYTFLGVTTTAKCYTSGDNKFVVASCTSKEMNTPVHIVVSDPQGSPIKEVDYSVKRYCDTKRSPSSTAAQALKDLCLATEIYGAEAQKYFGSTTEQVIPDTEYSIDALTAVPASYDAVSTGSCDGVEQIQASLNLASKTELNFYVYPAAGVSANDLTISINDNAISYETTGNVIMSDANNGAVKIIIKGISSVDLAQPYKLTVSYGSTSKSVTYSPLSWAYRNQNNDNERGISKSLYNYYLKAKANFG